MKHQPLHQQIVLDHIMIMIIMDHQLVVLDMAIDIIHRVLGMYYNGFCTGIVIYITEKFDSIKYL